MSILTDSEKEILKNHLTKVRTAEYNKAVELFQNSNDYHILTSNSYIRTAWDSVQIKNDEPTIQELQDAYNAYVSSLDSDTKVMSHCVSTNSDEYGDNIQISLDFVLCKLSHSIESMVKCSMSNIIRDFEFKYVHQRNGKDVARHIAYFEKIGIKID